MIITRKGLLIGTDGPQADAKLVSWNEIKRYSEDADRLGYGTFNVHQGSEVLVIGGADGVEGSIGMTLLRKNAQGEIESTELEFNHLW